MKNNFILSFFILLSFVGDKLYAQDNGGMLILKNAMLIDGTGSSARKTDLLISDGKILHVATGIKKNGASEIDLHGKAVIPELISAHMHIGLLKNTANKAENYTRENILRQLKRYQDYGVGTVLAMGSDRPMLFKSALRDSSVQGLLPGARLYSAGRGFGVPQGAPPITMGMDLVFRPSETSQVAQQMDSLSELKPTVVKLWLDDFNGKFTKMPPQMYRKIISEAHLRKLRVAAHAYYLNDARKLVQAGVNIIGHSIRDSVVDDAFLAQMKAKHVTYIPTLSLDEFAYIYARQPEWLNDPFFKASLEPGGYELITSKSYQDGIKNAPDYNKNIKAFETALINLKKIYAAGILVAFGTDSGAMPIRAQGFSEHLELELMVQAGLSPMEAIGVATKNSAILMGIEGQNGTLEVGKSADFVILDKDPLSDIKNTRSILAVYQAGKKVSSGPLSKRA